MVCDTSTGFELIGKRNPISAVCQHVFNDIFIAADNIIFTGSRYELVCN